MLGDEPGDDRCGRSSSAAKKADAVFKIALARRNSAFPRRNRLSSADSSLVTPGRDVISDSLPQFLDLGERAFRSTKNFRHLSSGHRCSP